MLRLFIQHDIQQNGLIKPSTSQRHYLTRVMRKKEGDLFLIFNGKDGQWIAQLTHDNMILVGSQVRSPQLTAKRAPTLVFAPTKCGRVEQVVQQATQMGCARICPIRTERTVVKSVKLEKMVCYSVEAAEQSGRLDVPQVEAMVSLQQFLKRYARSTNAGLLVCDERTATQALSSVSDNLNKLLSLSSKAEHWFILVGPEGGWSEQEIKSIRASHNQHSLYLGPRILRAETAVVAALTTYQMTLGDWNT